MTYLADTAGERFEVPEGSLAAGDRFRLPPGAGEPISVFVNGVEQRRDVDYRLRAGEIVFARPILKESRLGLSRWVALYLGLFGTYRTDEAVDVHFRLGGRMQVASDVALEGG